MLVYVRCENKVKKIQDVTLGDCYKPTIGDFKVDRVDPALWYKVLVLQAVFVDCDHRCVYWTVSQAQEASQFYAISEQNVSKDDTDRFFQTQGLSERLLMEDCYDFDPNTDELFDTAGKVFRFWEVDPWNSQDDLLKMLHVFILPKVKFSTRHSDQIHNVLQLIEVQHENIEDKIQKKDMTKKNTETSLRKQRVRILTNEDFSRTSYIATLSEKFLKVFLQHLEKDIRKLNEEFMSSGIEVEQLRNSVEENEVKRLRDRRVRRDSIFSDLQNAIAAKEEIKNVIVRNHGGKKFQKKSKRRSSHTVFHEVYMEVTARLQGMSKDIQNLINIKIKLSSVREAMLLSLRELEAEGETFGYNRKKGTYEMETDLYNPHNKPEEWSTLDEKVKLFLKAKQHGVRRKFEEFCSAIKTKCQRLFDEAKLFTISVSESDGYPGPPLSPTTAQRLNMLGAVSQTRRPSFIETHHLENERKDSVNFRHKFATTYTSRWSFGTIPKDCCENICQDIIEHLTRIATELAVEMKPGQTEIPRSFIWKVYICYEEHVSSQLMPLLNELYEHSYRQKCESLSNWIAVTPMSVSGFGEHIMANFLHLVPSEDSSEASSRETSGDLEEAEIEDLVIYPRNNKPDFSNSLSNKSVKDMTLQELYKYCDAENEEELPPMYQGMMGTDGASDSDDNVEYDETGLKTVHPSSESQDTVKPNTTVTTGLEIGEECVDGEESFVLVPSQDVNGKDEDSDANPKQGEPESLSLGEVTLRPKPPRVDSPSKQYSMMPMTMKQFCEQFSDFEKILKEEDEACTLFKKLRILTQALKYIETQISDIRKGTDTLVCSDDLLDVIILLLCHVQPVFLLKLYAHMNLLLHLRPNFMEGSAHDYALITFCGAFQHLFEQKMLSNNAASC